MSFSFIEACVQQWKSCDLLRKRAVNSQLLVVDVENKVQCLPTLQNMRLNAVLLRAYTSQMASEGFVVTKDIGRIRAPVLQFYHECGSDSTPGECVRLLAHATAFCLKRMLYHIRRKWQRWELPRAFRLKS